MYLVTEWMVASTPSSKGFRYSGVAQVASSRVTMFLCRAMAVIAGMSWSSKVIEPGDSRRMRRGVRLDILLDIGADIGRHQGVLDLVFLAEPCGRSAGPDRRRCRRRGYGRRLSVKAIRAVWMAAMPDWKTLVDRPALELPHRLLELPLGGQPVGAVADSRHTRGAAP